MDVLSPRELGRATLARQLLLSRVRQPALSVVEQLAGLQGQDPELPYFGLWNRIEGFALTDLTRLLEERLVLRATLFRGTQHLLAASDYLWVRPLLQPMLDVWRRGAFGRYTAGIAPAELAASARDVLGARTLTRSELGRTLARRWPQCDPQWLARSVQGLLPIVHPAPDGTWGRRGATPFAQAEQLLGRPLEIRDVQDLVRRYLAAFGPASARDMQAWSGMTRLREVFEALRPRLRVFHDDSGVELFDLPDAPRPGPDVPAPVRFLPGFDNVLFGHADRSRIVAAERRPYLVVDAALTVDGMVRGLWKIRDGVLEVRLFAPLSAAERAAVEREGADLSRLAGVDPAVRLVRL
ncbi:winged helix DNA-binding domain-containing protein [Actinoplanes sp. NPDC048967]|uniref:winged helix DNA-binding domain-containing protein n=1 Tax=Actinoplanes sp. NPDC048967 TaxID=3155269 RepID=UPI0033CFC434